MKLFRTCEDSFNAEDNDLFTDTLEEPAGDNFTQKYYKSSA